MTVPGGPGSSGREDPWRVVGGGAGAPTARRRARRRTGGVVLAVALAAPVALAGCSGSPSGTRVYVAPPTRSTAPAPASTTTSTTPAPSPVWLCRPGMADDPCTSPLTATVVPARGASSVQQASPSPNPKVDCFYVYPTVSDQPTANADLAVDPQETAVAVAQVARFSQVCNVYAPIYPQLTRAAITGKVPVSAADVAKAYLGVLDAWNYYLQHDNHGRGVVFIGHSQGASLLIALLARQVDDDPALRDRLVSAILLGGNVTVPEGDPTGGSFTHLPLCTDVEAPGCVIAYSSFDRKPPADSLFGRVTPAAAGGGAGTAANRAIQAIRGSAASTTTTAAGGAVRPLEVACVNPVPGPGRADATAVPPTTATAATPADPSTTTTVPRRSGQSRAPLTGVAGRPLIPYFPTTANAAVAAGLGGGAPSTSTSPNPQPTTTPPTTTPPTTTPADGTVTTPWVTYPLLYRAQCLRSGGATWLQVNNTNGPGGTRPVVTGKLGPDWGLHAEDVSLALGNLVDDVRHQAHAWVRAHGPSARSSAG